mmetsp:Transcript_353/g.480  ORF Transcript_353/g.480 Transcript_353/m.480 type:complete len:196 (+) Transcript_353:43-630(+)
MRLAAIIFALALFAHTINGLVLDDATKSPLIGASDGCDCPTYDACACCAWDVPVIENVCVNITWEDYTVYTYLIINNEVVSEREITDTRENVEMCSNIECNVCVEFENLNISYTGACGSIYLNVTCDRFKYIEDLGDWHVGGDCVIPKSPSDANPEGEIIRVPALDAVSERVNVRAKNFAQEKKRLPFPKRMKGH